jgi:uncharacterized protein YciI
LIAGLCGAAVAGRAQTPPSETSDTRLFAVEIRTGPRWDAAKPTGEQPFFREHSAHLRRLRDAGQLVVGARYGDKGFVVLAAPSAAAARALVDEDPSIAHGTFVAEVQEFRVFYPGTLAARPRPQ